MNYILNFMEYTMESGIIALCNLMIIIVGLIYIYSKREEDENNLGWKIIGFYLLGAFSVNFNTESIQMILPAGFTFYYFFMKNKPRLNEKTKKIAAIFGVIMLYVGVLSNIIYEKIEYRDHTIITSNDSIEYIKKDWDTIKDKLDITYSEIQDFNLLYKKDGRIEHLYYSVLDDNKKYHVSLYPKDEKYYISIDKRVNEDNIFAGFDGDRFNLNTDQFIDIIENTKFKKYKDANGYNIKYGNHIYTDSLEDKKVYTINHDDYSVEELASKNNIYRYSSIVYVPLNKVSEDSSDSISIDEYLVYYNYSEEDNDVSMYEGIEITMEDVEDSKSKIITDSYDVASIVREIKDGNWSEVKDLNIDIEPDLFIKDNKGNVIGLCEDESFARRDLDGISLWYTVSSNLYNNMKLYLYK